MNADIQSETAAQDDHDLAGQPEETSPVEVTTNTVKYLFLMVTSYVFGYLIHCAFLLHFKMHENRFNCS